MGSGIKIYSNFGIRDQNLRSKCGIRQEKIYLVATLSETCSWDNVSESAYPFSPAFDISEELCISINWLILSIFCIKKFPKSLARSSGAISFGNDTSDGSHSSDLVVQWLGHLIPIKLVCFSSIYRHSFRFTFPWKLGRKEFREKGRHVWFFFSSIAQESQLDMTNRSCSFLFFNTIHFWKIQDLAARFGKFKFLPAISENSRSCNSHELTHHP